MQVKEQEPQTDPANATNQEVTEFVLLGFSSLSPTLRLLFCSFLSAGYLFTLLGNLSIICAVLRDTELSRLPMYILLGNFSGLEMCYITITVPRMVVDLAFPPGHISFRDCFFQFYFFFSMATIENFCLTSMGLDRYLAICHPLRYPVLMSPRNCRILAACCWGLGFIFFPVPIMLISQLPFCGPNILDHFLCDAVPILALTCAPAPITEAVFYIITSFIILSTLLFIVASYGAVLKTVLKLPSGSGRQKAFSTCTSHLAVVSLYYGSATITYVTPDYLGGSKKVAAVFYAAITPLLNPLIYSLRNKEMKRALKKVLLQRC